MTAPEPLGPTDSGGFGPLCFLVGPTAVGKTAFALELAETLDADIVSMDSMQVYRGLDIGTAKPTRAERARVPHACLDLVPANERYDVSRYRADALAALGAARAAGRRALFVGGTGLYLKALTAGLFAGPPVDLELRARLQARARDEGRAALHAELATLDPSAAARIHPHDEKRVLRGLEVFTQSGRTLTDWQREWRSGAESEDQRARLVGLARPAAELAERIRRRVEEMFDAGWVEEARAIRAHPGFGPTSAQALGYREVLELADGRLGREECAARIAQRTRQFVRRQSTWFRSFASGNGGIEWLVPDAPDALARARRRLEGASGS